jgi:diguanylate cyclase (GGDEF)-like protein
MDSVAEYMFEYLRDILYDPAAAALDLSKLPEDFRELGEGLQFFAQSVSEVRAFAKALARGDFNSDFPSGDNELAAPLKMLHATLKHLIWQAQQVAKGDYRQHVDYLGDFAAAFNMMTMQLEQRQVALYEEIERSEQKARALAQSNDLFEIITKENAQWLVVIEQSSGEWLFCNYPVGNILAVEEFSPQLKTWLSLRVAELEAGDGMNAAELALTHGGLTQYFSVMTRPMLWRERPSVVFMLTDISAEHEHIQQLEDVAYRDMLTGQFNRHYGMRTLERLTDEKRAFALCFVDIDNLKYVNDKFGHNEGDKYILSVSAVLRAFSPDATICRLGGDEFMLLASGWTEENAAAQLEALRGRLLKRNEAPGAEYYHSMSYGVVGVSPGNDLPPSELLAVADAKMYEYKRFHKMERRQS